VLLSIYKYAYFKLYSNKFKEQVNVSFAPSRIASSYFATCSEHQSWRVLSADHHTIVTLALPQYTKLLVRGTSEIYCMKSSMFQFFFLRVWLGFQDEHETAEGGKFPQNIDRVFHRFCSVQCPICTASSRGICHLIHRHKQISFQKLRNFWVAKALMSLNILVEFL